MSYSERINSVKSDIDALVTYANETTGEADASISDAVDSLVSGYGGGGLENEIIARSISGGYNNTDITYAGSYALNSCNDLTSIDFPNVTSVGSYVFANCSNLTSINLPKLSTCGSNLLQNCSKLKSANTPLLQVVQNWSFSGCSKLETLDFKVCTRIGTGSLQTCNSLTKLILRNASTVCSYMSNISSYDPTNSDLKIYVPSALLESYKVATNWTRLADKFVALEDYTVDGTTTGEILA